MSETVNQRWAATVMGALVDAGVRHVVVAPGSRSTPLALAAADRPDLSCWSVIDERVGAFLALGLSKGSGSPAAVVCTSGTAGAHLLPAVIEAAEAGVPLVVVTADRPWELHGAGAAQTIAQEGLFGRYVHESLNLGVPEADAAVLKHVSVMTLTCVKRAGHGPVHLNVPFREPLASPSGERGPVASPSEMRVAPVRLVPDVEELQALLDRAERPMIVCGPREAHDGFAEAVHELGRHLGAPVLAEAASNARYGHDAIACYDAVWRSPAAAALKPDLILRFGGGLTAKSMISLDVPSVVVSEGGRLFDPGHHAQLLVMGDAVAVCRSLLSARTRGGRWRAQWHEVEAKVRAKLATRTEFDEPAVARQVVASLPPGSNLVVSSSMPIRDVDAFATEASGVLHVFSNRGVNGIDGVMSTALGIAASTRRPTTLLIGDVALLHDVGAWIAAKTLAISLTVVVVNNDGGGIFHFLPNVGRSEHFERFFGTPHGLDLTQVAGLASADVRRVTTAAALREALELPPALRLIEVRSERAANVDAHRKLFAGLAEVVS